jgi:hypothetical protein
LPLAKLSSSSLNLCTDTAPQLENTNGPTTEDSFSSVCFISSFFLLLLLRFNIYSKQIERFSLSLFFRLSVQATEARLFEKRERQQKRNYSRNNRKLSLCDDSLKEEEE